MGISRWIWPRTNVLFEQEAVADGMRRHVGHWVGVERDACGSLSVVKGVERNELFWVL